MLYINDLFSFFFLYINTHTHTHTIVCEAVKINSITVPSRYELKKDASDRLILDCDFSADDSEKGVVLKWHLNSVPIFQWIPSQKGPYALVSNDKHVAVLQTKLTWWTL